VRANVNTTLPLIRDAPNPFVDPRLFHTLSMLIHTNKICFLSPWPKQSRHMGDHLSYIWGIPNPLELVPRPHVLYDEEHRNRPMHAFQELYARVNLQELQEKVFWGRWRVCVAVRDVCCFSSKKHFN
jgi:hypothetical protein